MKKALWFTRDFLWGLKRLRPHTPARAWGFARQCQADLKYHGNPWLDLWMEFRHWWRGNK